jgi:hypothetical protein
VHADKLGNGDVARINAATSALSQISVSPEMSREQYAASYHDMVEEAKQLAAELGKALTYTTHHWSGVGEQPIALWAGPEYVGTSYYEAIGSVREILVRLRADVAKKRSNEQLIAAKDAQRQRDNEQIEEARRAAARQLFETSGYGDELAAVRAENAELREEIAQLRAFVVAQHAPQQAAVTPASGDKSSPGESPAVVVDQAADEFSEIATLKDQQRSVLDRFRAPWSRE